MADPYVTRIVDGVLDELLTSFPAISLVGPRAAGKTTTAVRRGATVLRLDRPDVRAAVTADPDAMLHGLAEPVGLDEWQEAGRAPRRGTIWGRRPPPPARTS